MATPTPREEPEGEVHCTELSEAVKNKDWGEVLRLVHADYSSPQQRHQAIERIVEHAPARFVDETIGEICNNCTDGELDSILPHLVSRGLWRCVGHVLQRDISHRQHKWAVEKASRHTDGFDFTQYILPHCYNEELNSVLTHLASRGLWWSVGEVLERSVSSPKHRWAVEQASIHAWDHTFTECILPRCSDEELESVLTHLVSKDKWQSVGKALERSVSSPKHRWAVEQASIHAWDHMFVECILPRCSDEELESVLTNLVSRGLWRSVDKVLERGVSCTQHRLALTEAMKHASKWGFAQYILPHCTEEELSQALTHMASRGVWNPFVNNVSVRQHVLSQLISQKHWKAVGRFLQRDISCVVHRWAVEEASRRVDDYNFMECILPHCYDEELESVLTHLVSQGMWKSVGKVLERGMSSSQHMSVLVEAAQHADDSVYHRYLVPHCSEDCVVLVAVLPHLVTSKQWLCVQHILWIMARDTLHTWMTSEPGSRAHDALFWKFIHTCNIEVSEAFFLTKATTQQITHKGKCANRCFDVIVDLVHHVSCQKSLCELLITTLLHTLCYMICSADRENRGSTENAKQCVFDIYTHITACVEDITHCVRDSILETIHNKEKWISVFTDLADSHGNDPLFLLHFLQGLNLYHISRRGLNDDAVLLAMLAVFPLFPQLQSVALRIMLHEKRWDVIHQACLSHVWEHDRRRLFKAAVMQRQWDVVWQWCDHTVHDDQRHWALTEAFKEKQWEVYLLLADHGLTVDEQMYAHYRVAKYGDWATVLNMVDRGGDITEVSNLLEKWVMRYLRKKPEGDVTMYEQRCMKLIRLRLRFARKSALSPRKALERCLWGSVFFNILHRPTKRFFSEVLDKVLEEQQWHVLMHLVRLGMTSADRDRLFPDMVRQQQWGVCAKLLEYGVDDQLCLEALPQLMMRDQWMLVARVMEHDVDDAVRRQVLLWAFQRRAGALFWHCLNSMEDQKQLSSGIKNTLFHQAISREIWQAAKPMVKEKAVRHLLKETDDPIIQRRDLAFLEAIEQHLWDVVDYCQRLGADINMKDENGETPLNREARKREWKAVEEIVLRDGYPNHLDKDGVSVMNRLIYHEQWDIVKVVIKYGGDIHLSAKYHEHIPKTHSPLQALITARQADVIHSTIKWCGGQDWGVNDKGERVLHAVCDSDRWDVMRNLIDIKVNPLVLTNTGKSPLAYAVLNTKCGQRMVAECSRQGFSLHQPSLTGPQESLLHDVSQTVVGFSSDWMDRPSLVDYIRWKSEIMSPLVCAVLCDLPVVAFMLYESGSCSNTELFTLHTQLPKLIDLDTEEGRALHERVRRKVASLLANCSVFDRRFANNMLQRNNRLTHTLQQYTPFLRELATTPRPLLSSCRLKILQSQCFHFSNKYREEVIDDIPLPEVMKKYLKFFDLCDPDCCGHMK